MTSFWLLGLLGFVAAQQVPSRSLIIASRSPDGRVAFEVRDREGLQYRIVRDDVTIVDWSTLAILVDSVDLSKHAVPATAALFGTTDESYPTRGVHALTRNHSLNTTLTFSTPNRTVFSLVVRVFDDGVGFRFIVAGSGTRTPDEGITFNLPKGSTTWSHGLTGHYEGTYVKRAIEDVPQGDWAAPPLTYKLPGDAGYASITEAALFNYAGMALQADGRGGYAARLGHAQPPSYPFTLRYKPEDVQRLSVPATITGTITTPWRVVLVSKDLNGLVNNDVIHDLAPPPDPAFFPQGTAWIRPGRAVWRYLDGGDNTYDGLKHFTDLAAELGFEYHVVEGIWSRWTPEQLKAFVDYATARHVGIFLWKHSRDLRTPEQRAEFFALCQRNGVVGAKIDFFDHEAKETVDLYEAILREAAAHHILIDFHGANKPTGGDRTWPNELTREAIYGLEHRGSTPWGPQNTTAPFARFLAGGADYTPVVFSDRRRETSWTHQVASAVVFTSPLLVYGAHPQTLIDSAAADVIRNIPATWDETIVLPGSEIGDLAAFARRSGRDWFIGVMNGGAARPLTIYPSFLGSGRYSSVMASDVPGNAADMHVERKETGARDPIHVELREGGGFVARLVPVSPTR